MVVRRDYTGRDYDSLKQAVLDHVERQYPNLFNDLNEDHLPVVLLEGACYVGDGLAFYLDQQHNEGFRDSYLERQSGISLGKLVGYAFQGPSSATVTLTCQIASQAEDTVFAKGTKISTEDGAGFEVAETKSVPSGTTEFTLDVIHGETQEDTFLSDGTSSQIYLSTAADVVGNVDWEVTVDDVAWTVVDALWGYTDENVCELTLKGDGTLRLVFGDGVHGNVPGLDQSIVLTYFTGGGVEGNVEADAFEDQTLNGELEISSTPVTATVISSTAGSGGEAETSVEEGRQNMKLSLSLKKSLTNEEDFEAFAEEYAGVLSCSASSDKVTSIITLVLLSTSYGTVSEAIKTEILEDIGQGTLINMTPQTEDVVLVYFDLEATVYVQNSYNKDDIQVAVDQALNDFFHPVDTDLLTRSVGDNVNMSDIIALIDNVPGVDHLDVTKFTRKLTPIKSASWLADSDKAAFDVDAFSVGTTTTAGTWTLSFDFSGDLTKFNVRDPNGISHTPGYLDTPYTSDSGEIGFTLEAGTSPMEVGDYATIEVALYKDNITVLSNEFMKIDDYSSLTFEYVT